MRYLAAIMLAAGFMFLVGLALWEMPSRRENLAGRVAQALPESGVDHPVTAVLLNFRGYDTLLEIAVLLVAISASLALRQASDARPRVPLHDPLLGALVEWLVPLMILVAGYLLWAGKHQPGGAFQAGAVLAASGVLVRLSGLRSAPRHLSRMGRTGLVVGFCVFLGVAVAPTLAGLPLLTYPADWAGPLILLVETFLTLSIGWILLSLFDSAPAPQDPSNAGRERGGPTREP